MQARQMGLNFSKRPTGFLLLFAVVPSEGVKHQL